MIECSVVVPTCRRRGLLERCIDALVHQRMPAGTLEVLIADDAADAATRAQVTRWTAHERPVRYVPIVGASHGPAAARNAGWRAALGWLIAFTDDDTVPDANWLVEAHAAFSSLSSGAGRSLDAAWGRTIVPLPPRPTDYERDASGLERAGFVTANCFVRRDVLESIAGFDETFTSAWREDSDLYFRLLAAGRRVEHLARAVVVHPVRRAPWGVSLTQQKKAIFDALLYRKHPERFVRAVPPGRPWLYYAIVASMLATLAGASVACAELVGAGLGTWMSLSMLFAARRLRGTSRAPAHVAEMLVTSFLIPPLSLYWRVRGACRYRVMFW